MKKKERKLTKKLAKHMGVISPKKAAITSLFLDSGAVSLLHRDMKNQGKEFFDSEAFWSYVDAYASFLKRHKKEIAHYANVDIIREPEQSWKVQQYLENKYKLEPVPVVHKGPDAEKWLRRYIELGYDLIGLGGMAAKFGTSASGSRDWLDRMFSIVCDTKDKYPRVRIHGFSVTTVSSMIRWPWWSVDSTSWKKMAAFGQIWLPRKLNGKFEFIKKKASPVFCTREASVLPQHKRKHLLSLSSLKKSLLFEWLEEVQVPLGGKHELGIINSYKARQTVNVRYYMKVVENLPDWPWPFQLQQQNEGFSYE